MSEKNEEVSLDHLIKKALENAEEDRNEINKFIANLLKESIQRPSNTKNEFGDSVQTLKNHELAPLLIKQYETKIKANEQLIKLASILQKREGAKSQEDEDFLLNFDSGDFYEKLEEEEKVVSKKEE